MSPARIIRSVFVRHTLIKQLSLMVALGLIGCESGGAQRHRLGSRDPLERAKAVVAAAERSDPQAVPKLVDLLEDDDRAVRLYSILALERLCGTNMGYRYYDNERQRALAVERWRAALRDGNVRLTAPGGSPTEPAPSVGAP